MKFVVNAKDYFVNSALNFTWTTNYKILCIKYDALINIVMILLKNR